MATDPSVPFQFLAAGNAEAPKVQADFEAFLKYVRDRNDGTTAWDSFKMTGTTTNDSAATGIVGEYVSSAVVFSANFPANDVFGDGTSISLTPGDWDITAQFLAVRNTATWSFVIFGISTASGNDSSGLTRPTTAAGSGWASSSTTPTDVPSHQQTRASISSTTTYYAKVYALYSAGQPQYRVHLFARRVR